MQIMDSFQNKTYVNGQAASIYKQGIPLANAAANRASGRPTTSSGRRRRSMPTARSRRPAYVTAFHNGVLVQNTSS